MHGVCAATRSGFASRRGGRRAGTFFSEDGGGRRTDIRSAAGFLGEAGGPLLRGFKAGASLGGFADLDLGLEPELASSHDDMVLVRFRFFETDASCGREEP